MDNSPYLDDGSEVLGPPYAYHSPKVSTSEAQGEYFIQGQSPYVFVKWNVSLLVDVSEEKFVAHPLLCSFRRSRYGQLDNPNSDQIILSG